MMGRSYVIDHCITAANHEEKHKVYQNYIAECLRVMTENIAMVANVLTRGEVDTPYMSGMARDILWDQKKEEPKKKELTAEEVIADIMADLGANEVETE